MADRSIVVRIGANVTGLVNGLKTAQQATKDWANDTQAYIAKNEQHINSMSAKFGLAGAALTAFAVLAVKSFADFDAAMSSVQAATMETADNMGLLRDAAIEAGSRTVYSATEAAGAIEELAKAGVSTADILGGGLDGALDLAASGAIAVGDAAEIAATAMTQFGLKGSDVTHIADLLAAGAGKAQGGVGDLGMALKQTGLVANQTGLSIEETTGGLAAFAKAGLIGSDAGTSFKTMLQRLTPQSLEAKKEMDRLGISAYDAQGQFIGLANFAGNLQSAMKDLTPEQRNASMSIIFGSDAVRAANVLYDQGAAGIKQWTAAVNDQGYAAEQARIRMDNLKGDIENLSGSLETALIGIGEGADGPLRSLVQQLDNVVDAFNGLPDGAKSATLAITGGGGLALLGVAGMGKLVTSISEAKTAMQALGVTAKGATVAVGAVGAVLAVGTYALTQWAEAAAESKQNTDDFAETLDDATGAVTGSTRAMAAQKVAASDAGRVYKAMGGNVSDLTSAVMGNADALARVNALLDAQPKDSFAWMEFDNTAVDAVRSGVQGLSDDLDDSRSAWQLEAEAAAGSADATDEAASAVETYSAAAESGTATVDEYTAALEELIKTQAEAAGVVMDLWDAQNQLEQAYADASKALTDNGRTLDVTTEKGRANREALMGISEAGWDLIESMRANGATQGDLQNQVQTTRDRFLAAAEAFGMSSDEAVALADSLNLIPTNVSVQVAADTSSAQSAIDNVIRLNNGRRMTLYMDGTFQVNGSSVKGFDGGGYTGDGGKHQPAGIVHRGEFVVNKEATARNRPLLEAINSGASGYAQGGYVSRQYAAPTYITQAAALTSGATYDVKQYITSTDPEGAGIASARHLRETVV